MSKSVWINQRQPQTLYISQFLLYFSAVISIFDQPPTGVFSNYILRNGLLILIVFGSAGGAFGIANNRRWGYILGIAAAIAPFAIRFELARQIDIGFAIEWNIIGGMFDIALIAALLHPMSRDHQKIWFR
jgi:hypothetical protein